MSKEETMNNFQRVGAVSNSHVGREFEARAREYFESHGISLEAGVSIKIGIEGKSKAHMFDLGDLEKQVLVECKSHTWTAAGKVPSGKMKAWNEAMYYFFAAPRSFRKIFFVLKDYNQSRQETLLDYYLRTYDHLVPSEIEFWEYDEKLGTAERKR
jgi:hypothetical protein